MLEARLEGRPPITVTHHADTIQLAVDVAANNLVALTSVVLVQNVVFGVGWDLVYGLLQ